MIKNLIEETEKEYRKLKEAVKKTVAIAMKMESAQDKDENLIMFSDLPGK